MSENTAPQQNLKKEEPTKFNKQWLYENIKSFGIAIFLVLIIRSSIIEAFKIPSGSMIPTLYIGDHIFVNKFAYGIKLPFSDLFSDKPFYLSKPKMPNRGDIIVFKNPQKTDIYFIKRVIGIPGDRIRVQDKILFVNDKPLERNALNKPDVIDSVESKNMDKTSLELFEEVNQTTGNKHYILQDKNNYITETFPETTVPEDSLFVMGDNRDNSNDSRFWGFVPFDLVRGKAMVIWLCLWLDFQDSQYYFHPSRIGTIIR